MIKLNEIDLKVLYENFDEETINQIDPLNAEKIFKYLEKKGIYYAKDLYLLHLDLFLLSFETFKEKFEKIVEKLGDNYVEILGEDLSFIDIMYQ